jgi:uncharacterized protein YqcC (DUF446 family)
MNPADPVTDKIHEVTEEMKRTGLWKKQVPSWVSGYDESNIVTESDFSEWLQFVYLPNLLAGAGNRTVEKHSIVPQAVKFFGEDMKKGIFLRLLIELDSLL